MVHQSGKLLITTIIILLLVAILLAVTNPDKEAHQQAITSKLADKDMVTNVLNLGLMALKSPDYHNLALISYTRTSDKTASVGIFNYVWVNEDIFK